MPFPLGQLELVVRSSHAEARRVRSSFPSLCRVVFLFCFFALAILSIRVDMLSVQTSLRLRPFTRFIGHQLPLDFFLDAMKCMRYDNRNAWHHIVIHLINPPNIIRFLLNSSSPSPLAQATIQARET